MHTTRAIGATATLLAVLAASGCGGSSGGSSSTSAPSATHTSKSGIASGEPTPAKTSKSSTMSASSSAKPTPSSKGTAAGAPGVPEAARQHTKAGAKAFAEYFYGQVNALYQNPASGTVESLSLASCTFCKDTSKDLKKMAHEKQRLDGPTLTVNFTKTEMVFDRSANVFMTLHQLPANRVDENGNTVDTVSTMSVKSVNVLKWVNKKGWRVEDVEHE